MSRRAVCGGVYGRRRRTRRYWRRLSGWSTREGSADSRTPVQQWTGLQWTRLPCIMLFPRASGPSARRTAAAVTPSQVQRRLAMMPRRERTCENQDRAGEDQHTPRRIGRASRPFSYLGGAVRRGFGHASPRGEDPPSPADDPDLRSARDGRPAPPSRPETRSHEPARPTGRPACEALSCAAGRSRPRTTRPFRRTR